MPRVFSALCVVACLMLPHVASATTFIEFRMDAPFYRDRTDSTGSEPDESFPRFIVGGHLALSDHAFQQGMSVQNGFNPRYGANPAPLEFGWFADSGLEWLDFWFILPDKMNPSISLANTKDDIRFVGGEGFRFIVTDLREYATISQINEFGEWNYNTWWMDLQSSPGGIPQGSITFHFRRGDTEVQLTVHIDGDGSYIHLASEGSGLGCYQSGACVGDGAFIKSNRRLSVPEAGSISIFGAAIVSLLLSISAGRRRLCWR